MSGRSERDESTRGQANETAPKQRQASTGGERPPTQRAGPTGVSGEQHPCAKTPVSRDIARVLVRARCVGCGMNGI